VLEQAAAFYQQQLERYPEALHYLCSRRLSLMFRLRRTTISQPRAGAARKLLRHCLISRILVGGGRHARWATTVSCNSLENNFGTPVLCVQFYLSQLSRQAANSLGLI
jgi:hypothetical protein